MKLRPVFLVLLILCGFYFLTTSLLEPFLVTLWSHALLL